MRGTVFYDFIVTSEISLSMEITITMERKVTDGIRLILARKSVRLGDCSAAVSRVGSKSTDDASPVAASIEIALQG
jgi:hypothetical protein